MVYMTIRSYVANDMIMCIYSTRVTRGLIVRLHNEGVRLLGILCNILCSNCRCHERVDDIVTPFYASGFQIVTAEQDEVFSKDSGAVVRV